ncbi:MAG: helix-turn-helix transcriptional regulator [Acidimicrobiales bacterium]|nr:helix-turn-helix transcriptional regulator [Acidimicrobiales bacterium]
MPSKTSPPDPSPLARALARVGDRWSLLVVEALMGGPRRFADLQEAMPGIATNVLAQRLRQLEADRLILAVPYSQRPPRFSYDLTDSGRGLGGAMWLLAQWSSDHGGGATSPVHDPCGTPLVARWWCPTCEQPGDPEAGEAIWV